MTAFWLVSKAIKDLLKTLPMIFSNMGICRLGVRVVLMLKDATGDVKK